MANTKLSALSQTFGSGYSTSDVMLLLDVADTSMAASGTDKGILVSTFLSQYIHAGSNVTLTPGSNGVTVAASAGLTAIASHDVLANITGSSAVPVANTVTDVIDAAIGSTRGAILYRGASGWTVLSPGTSTYVLASQGAGADPTWAPPATGGSGASTANTYIVQTTASDCPNAQVLASLSTGLIKVTTTTGALTTAAAGTDYVSPSGTWIGNSSITTLGTVTTGVWNGTAIGASYLPSTGLTITQWSGQLGSGSISGGTATFNLATYNRWALTLDHTQTVTLALSGGTVGQQFSLLLSQDSTGSCLVTWFSGIKWAGGSAPTLTTTASKGDLFTFLCVGTGSYWGMIAGQNF